jgi:exopolyphosphatase/pppGpp-phosphohydrolase
MPTTLQAAEQRQATSNINKLTHNQYPAGPRTRKPERSRQQHAHSRCSSREALKEYAEQHASRAAMSAASATTRMGASVSGDSTASPSLSILQRCSIVRIVQRGCPGCQTLHEVVTRREQL